MTEVQPIAIIFFIIFLLMVIFRFVQFKKGYGLQGKWSWLEGRTIERAVSPKKATKNQRWFFKNVIFVLLVGLPFSLFIILRNQFDHNLLNMVGVTYIVGVLFFWFFLYRKK